MYDAVSSMKKHLIRNLECKVLKRFANVDIKIHLSYSSEGRRGPEPGFSKNCSSWPIFGCHHLRFECIGKIFLMTFFLLITHFFILKIF